MKLRLKAVSVSTDGLAEKRQVLVTVSTDQLDRTKDVMVQAGIDLDNFRRTKTVLWNHDQDEPIASCLSIDVVGTTLQALVQFPGEGVDAQSDRIYGLIKAGIVNAASVGFLPVAEEPLDPKNPRAGSRITKSELLEFSFVSVPANPGALIQERAMRPRSKTVGKMSLKGLWAIGQLASLLGTLGYMAEDAAWEREYEGDASEMPEVLADICKQVGAALQAMTAEEVRELLAGLPNRADDVDIVVDVEGKGLGPAGAVLKALAPRREKAGRTLSAATLGTLDDACKSIMAGHDAIKAMVDDSAATAADPAPDDAGAKALAAAATKNAALRAKRQRQFEFASLEA